MEGQLNPCRPVRSPSSSLRLYKMFRPDAVERKLYQITHMREMNQVSHEAGRLTGAIVIEASLRAAKKNHSVFCIFWRACLAAAQPSLVTCRARPTARAPSGTSFVMQEPAPMKASS